MSGPALSALAETPRYGEDVKFPVVVKPARQGSSVGLQFVERVNLKPGAEVVYAPLAAGREDLSPSRGLTFVCSLA